ncbi:hypothetical protein [Streptomyces sp. YGL11-2]|uniref:hypothetical protein n=1 Tax=Streptomyces sp. YGL11-2 TaxID=3414028 RepID=UPI003CEFA56A
MSALRRPSSGPLTGVLSGVLLAALVLLATVAVLPRPAYAAGSGLDTVAEALRKSPVYVDPRVKDQLPDADRDALAKKIRDADKPVFVAVLPDTAEFPKKTLLKDLRTRVGVTGVYAVHLAGVGFNAGADRTVLPANAVQNLRQAVRDSHSRDDAKGAVTDFANQAIAQAHGTAPSSWGDDASGGSGGSTTGLIAAGAVVAGAGGGYALYRRNRKRREQAELEQLRVVVDEDITAFGEALEHLDFNPSEPGATDDMRADYTTALDAYDLAKTKMAGARVPGDVRAVTDALERGRFALATLAARRTGAPLPEHRKPCFFDPRHGPSTVDVQWAPPGGAPRPVPACAADATRLADGQEPMSRTVQTADGQQPYWNAGPAYSPWAGGYFGSGVLPALVAGTVLGSLISAPSAYADSPSFFGGTEGGTDSGANFNPADFGGGWGDGGGFDGGGFDGGGGDW